MAVQKIPYPPTPTNVPDDLTDYPASYRSQQNLLLAGLFVFLMFYFGLIALCMLLGTYFVVTLNELPVVKIIGIVFCTVAFLFLVKGFFKREAEEKELQIEVTEEDQPVLFNFIHRLCDELEAPEPNRVYLTLDVNAAVRPRTSLLNIFMIEPKKDLIIGMGLVNACNLSEFKSVLAHEFGHFSQSAHSGSYAYVASKIIIDLVVGEDWFDRMIDWCKRQDNIFSVFGLVVGACLWVGRKVLEWILKVITLQRLAVMREQEFHADKVAVKAAGSDAVVLSLMRLRFGNLCLMQAIEDLRKAADHKLYTRDIFHHQERAEPIVRRLRKAPELGLRPDASDPMAGKTTRVFDPEQEELEHDEIPEMRRTHPPAHETEENAKETFIPAVVDIRSPWILFADTVDLKERLSYKFYRMSMRIPRDTELADPQEVQQYIDNEHADTTYDPKYQGIYDDRVLEPGELADLNQLIRESPWGSDRIEKVFEKLYHGARGKAEEYDELRKELATLDNTPGEKSPRLKKKIKKLNDDIEHAWEWYKSLDRRVYLVHVQMAATVNGDWRDELVERYRFQLEVQRMYQEARFHQGKADAYASYLFNQNPDEVHPELVSEVMQVLRQAWRALKKIIQDARDVNLPAMRNFEEGERLADFILEEKLVAEPPLSYIKGKWVIKLLNQLQSVKSRCFRLHFKSVGGILALQEKIAITWQQSRVPVDAVVVEDLHLVASTGVKPPGIPYPKPVSSAPAQPEPSTATRVPAGESLIDSEFVDAEVVDAEVVDAEVVDAEVVDAEVVENPGVDAVEVVETTVSSMPIVQDHRKTESPIAAHPWIDPSMLSPTEPKAGTPPAQSFPQSLPSAGPVIAPTVANAQVFDTLEVVEATGAATARVSPPPILDHLETNNPVVEDPWSDPRILPPEPALVSPPSTQVSQPSLPSPVRVVDVTGIKAHVFGALDVVEAILIAPPKILDRLEPRILAVEDPWSDPRILPPDAPLDPTPYAQAFQQSLSTPEPVFALEELTSPVAAVSPAPLLVSPAIVLSGLFPASEPLIVSGPIPNPEPNPLSLPPSGDVGGIVPPIDTTMAPKPSEIVPPPLDTEPQPTQEPAHTPSTTRFDDPVADHLSFDSKPSGGQIELDFEAPTVADGQNLFSRDLFRAALNLKPISGPTAPSPSPEPDEAGSLLDAGKSPSTPAPSGGDHFSREVGGTPPVPTVQDSPMHRMPAALPPTTTTDPSGSGVSSGLEVTSPAQNFGPTNPVGVSVPLAAGTPRTPAVNEPTSHPMPNTLTPAATVEPLGPASKPELPVAPPTRNPAKRSITKPAKNGRPAIRITFVQPGETSPLDPPS
jgi:Zn-dependent protease with chaperone function